MTKIFRQILISIIVLLLVAIFYFVYNYFLQDKIIKKDKIDLARELYIKNMFSDLASGTNLMDGFWYVTVDEYGNESISFFNPKQLVANNISDEDLIALYNKIKNAKVSAKSSFSLVLENKLPPNMQFYNKILSTPLSNDQSYLDIKKALEASYFSKTATKEDLVKLAYLYGLEGNYKERNLINKKLCSDFKFQCSSNLEVKILGLVKDGKGNLVQNAKISVFGDSTVPSVFSDEKGNYSLSIGVNELEKVRLKVSKLGFSDAVVSISVLDINKKTYQAAEAVIASANYNFTLDTLKKTITGAQNSIEGNNVTIKTSQSKYTIPFGVFFDKNDKPFEGQIEVVAYEFNRETVPLSMMTVDTFDAARGYAGNLMQTFGMPYIQFYDKNGNELFVKKSSPIKLEYDMYHIDDLYSGNTNVYEPITVQDMERIIAFCKKSTIEYPINRQFIIDNDLYKLPAWWIFDQGRGIWDNVGYRLVDTKGKTETLFYTIKDV
jgi:hypothetical protein